VRDGTDVYPEVVARSAANFFLKGRREKVENTPYEVILSQLNEFLGIPSVTGIESF
jgi:hypothetical protein